MNNVLSQTEPEIPHALMVLLNEVIRKSIGLYFPENRWPELQRKIMIMGRDLNLGDARATVQWLLDLPHQQRREDLLTCYLTIGETFFFRDQEVWNLLRQAIIPERMAAQKGNARQLTLWSAACSSGEEPYSMAMTVAQIPTLEEWDVTILATDINKNFIAKAQQGDYSKWSFRNMNSWLVSKYFNKKNDNCYSIAPSLKKTVTFLQLNLAGNNYPSGLNHTQGVDVIFCRNVLMYFPAKLRQRVINRLFMALHPNGWLLLSASEIGFITHPGLNGELVDGVHVFRKQGAALHTDRPGKYFPPSSGKTFRPQQSQRPAPAAHTQPDEQTQQPRPVAEPEKKDPAETGMNDSLMAQYQAADKLFQDRCYEDARIKLLELLESNELQNICYFKTKALALLARTHANQGNLTEARNLGEQVIALDRLNTGYYYFLATVCQEQGEKLQAIRLLKQSLYLEHDFVLAHFQLAGLVTDQAEARKYLKNTLSLLSSLPADEVLAGSEGLTVGRLRETAQSMLARIGD
ncbi:MAG: CheR family methyltransferase [Thermodesulfobacteriota bacterium]